MTWELTTADSLEAGDVVAVPGRVPFWQTVTRVKRGSAGLEVVFAEAPRKTYLPEAPVYRAEPS